MVETVHQSFEFESQKRIVTTRKPYEKRVTYISVKRLYIIREPFIHHFIGHIKYALM